MFSGGASYCKGCRDHGYPCADGKPGENGELCPLVVHQMQSQQGFQVWDVLQKVSGQLRLGGMGSVAGIDLNAAFRVGEVLGYDLAALAELMPYAERGLISGMRLLADRNNSAKSGDYAD